MYLLVMLNEHAVGVYFSRRESGTLCPAKDLRYKSMAESRNKIHLLVNKRT